MLDLHEAGLTRRTLLTGAVGAVFAPRLRAASGKPIRGVFKTQVSRQREVRLTPEAIAEIEFSFAPLKPYLRVG